MKSVQVQTPLVKLILAALAVPAIFFFTFWRLDQYPTINGWDEGIYLQYGHNISESGVCGCSDNDLARWMYPAPATGPTVLYPIGFIHELLPDNLFAARALIALYMLAAIAGLFLLVRALTRWEIALASVFLFMVAGYANFDTLWLARQVLGEVPAYAFLFFGLWFLVRALREPRAWNIIWSAVFLGLTVLTKNQLIWVLAPSLGVMFLLDLFYFKQKRWLVFFAAGAACVVTFAAWSLISLSMVGDDRAFYLATQSAAFKVTYLGVNFFRIKESLKMFLFSGFVAVLGIPLLVVFFSAFQRSLQGLVRAVFVVTAGFGLVNLFFLSLPWARYLNTGIVLGLPVIAIFMNDLVPWFRQRSFKHWAALAAWLAAGAFVLANLAIDVRLILTNYDDTPRRFAQVVDQIVPAGENVLNWEWEVEFYSRSSFSHPDFRLLSAMIDSIYNKHWGALLGEPRISAGTRYVIVGPFSTLVKTFDEELAEKDAEAVGQVGAYTLYEIH